MSKTYMAKDARIFINGQEIIPIDTEINIGIEGPKYEPLTRKQIAEKYYKEIIAGIENSQLSGELKKLVIEKMLDQAEELLMKPPELSLKMPRVEPDFKSDRRENGIHDLYYANMSYAVVPKCAVLIRDITDGRAPRVINKYHKNTMNLKTFINRRMRKWHL